MKRPRLAAELPAGLAALSLRLHGGAHCRPPISRMGNKAGYAASILGALGLRSGQGADAYLWAEADPDVAALIRCYPDAAMLLRIAEIIRSWADEEPRALWNRLRAERKARGVVAVSDVAGWIVDSSWGNGMTPGVTVGWTGGYKGPGSKNDHVHIPATLDAQSERCHALAEYATIATSNRLINVAGPDLVNTGKGGTTFGGAEFATPAGEVAGAFERVAGWMYVNANSWKGEGDHWKDPSDDVIAQGITVCRSAAGIARDLDRAASRWPPVVVLPRIPAAADVAKWLGTPGDLEGCVIYSDPPYVGTTGYAANLTRAEVVSIAVEYASMGATVAVSEAVALPELLALGWHATEITAGRVGQSRTFSKQKQEFLTMNREPAHRIATQPGLFGVAP